MIRTRTGRLVALAFILIGSAPAAIRTLTILHTNDLHAHLTPLEDGRGGFAYLAAAIRRERDHCAGCILLNAGDLVQGTPVSTIFHGAPVYEIANLLGFDAATLGNHEFDYGWAEARKFIGIAKFPVVSCDIVDEENRLFARPYVILNVNKLRVAIVGAETDDLHNLTTPKQRGPWRTLPIVETVRRYAAELRDKSDLIVLLAHITGEEETQLLDSEPDVGVIVSGHIHKGLDREISRHGRVLARVKGYGQELGRLDLKIDTEKKAPVAWTWTRIPIDSTKIAPAPDVARVVARWESEVSARVDKPLAISERQFDQRELKRLIERAMREETGADFAFLNLGGVRDVLPKGPLLVRNIWNIMPFDNDVVVGTFKGRDLPAAVVDGAKIDAARNYTLAVSDFTAANQGTRENLGTSGLMFPRNDGLLRNLILDWFRKQKVIR